MYIVYLVPYQSKNFCRLSTTNEPQSCTIYTELPEIGSYSTKESTITYKSEQFDTTITAMWSANVN